MILFFLQERKVFGISARKFAILFVCMNIVAFIIQGVGCIASGGPGENLKTVKLGLHVYMRGIGIHPLFHIRRCYLQSPHARARAGTFGET